MNPFSSMTPEHLHLLLNHLPVAGCAFAALTLLLGLLSRSVPVCRAGMTLALAATLVMPLVMKTGEKADTALSASSGAMALDRSAARWLHEHEERAENLAVAFLVILAAAAAALALSWLKPAWSLRLGGAILLLCLVGLVGGAWIAEAGGKIRHPELRTETRRPHAN